MQDAIYPNGAIVSRHEYDVMGEVGDVIRSIATALPVGFASGYLDAMATEVADRTQRVRASLLMDGLVSELGA